jgi:phage FluMu protein Com
MGMFNYVKFEMKCPNCGTIVNTFQTKDDYNY